MKSSAAPMQTARIRLPTNSAAAATLAGSGSTPSSGAMQYSGSANSSRPFRLPPNISAMNCP